jgi:hypothetical protein
LEWYEILFTVIDLRSFSNLWYWIGLAVLWSTASHWVLGVPFDMILRARRRGGEAALDLEALARINARRLNGIAQRSGLGIVAFSFFLLAFLATLAVLHDFEFAQALLFLMVPMMAIFALTLRLAARVTAEDPPLEALVRMMLRHRMVIQLIGMLSIFVTALFGMYKNFSVGALH